MQSSTMPGHLIRRLHQVSSHVFVTQAKAAGYDITPVQFAAIDALHSRPHIDQASLAQLIACDRPTTGGVIDRLEVKGLVERRVSPHDRRAREVALTDEGLTTFTALLPVVEAVQAAILASLDGREQKHFVELVAKMISTAEAQR